MIDKIKDNLKIHFTNLNVSDKLYYDKSVETFEYFLKENLRDTFYNVCNSFDRDNIQSIQGIILPFRNTNIQFSIEVFNNHYLGKYTSWCPELMGCITEGNSKLETLNNLCTAIAEVMILNYDYLNINPIQLHGITPKVTVDYFINTLDYQSYSFSKILFVEYGFKDFYLGKNHLLLKNPNDNEKTITLPYQGFQQVTKHLIEYIAKLKKTIFDRFHNMDEFAKENYLREILGLEKNDQDSSLLTIDDLF